MEISHSFHNGLLRVKDRIWVYIENFFIPLYFELIIINMLMDLHEASTWEQYKAFHLEQEKGDHFSTLDIVLETSTRTTRQDEGANDI